MAICNIRYINMEPYIEYHQKNALYRKCAFYRELLFHLFWCITQSNPNLIKLFTPVAVFTECTHPHTWSRVPHQTSRIPLSFHLRDKRERPSTVLSGIPFSGLADPPRSLWKQDIVKTETCCFWHERLVSPSIQRGLQLAWPAPQNKYSPL